jgi:transcriptional regulator with XRE-family HTH domain
MEHALSQADVARAIGLSRSRYSRLERGLVPQLAIHTASRLAAVVGLDLSIRTYPGGRPVRDAIHASLIGALRPLVHVALSYRLEVPMPQPGDRRAWDAVIAGRGWRFGVEAETRPTDVQAMLRRIALKERDGDVNGVILLLADTRHNRDLLRHYGQLLEPQFPVPGAEALAALAGGRPPAGNAVILLPLPRAREAHT